MLEGSPRFRLPQLKGSTPRATEPKKAPAKRRKGPPEDPMTKQVRKLDAIIQAIRDKERVLVTRLTVVKKLCENPEAASAFALFIARRAQERLRDKKAKERYRQLANRAVKEMKSYLDDPTEDGKWRLLDLLQRDQGGAERIHAHKLGSGPQHQVLGSPGRREGTAGVHATGGSQVLALSSGCGITLAVRRT